VIKATVDVAETLAQLGQLQGALAQLTLAMDRAALMRPVDAVRARLAVAEVLLKLGREPERRRRLLLQARADLDALPAEIIDDRLPSLRKRLARLGEQ
jgi:hypothetical protein